MARSRSVGSRRTVRLGSYGAERGEGRSGRGHRCVPGLLQEGPGGVHKGDGIRQQTEGREKQQGAGDGAREDVASQAFDLPCRREAKDLTPSAALPRADALGVGGWGGALHSSIPAAARGPAGFGCLPPPPWPPGPKHAPACRSGSPKARKSAAAPARHVEGRPREPRRTCTLRRGRWRWSGLGAGCPGCPGRCCSCRSCEAAPEAGCGWRCAGPGG